MSNIGKNIMKRRKELKWTQEELATKMGYKSKSTINKIELGINDIPQSKIAKFSEVLGVSIGYLMGWRDEIKENPEGKAELYADIMMDKDFVELYEDFKKLDDKEKQMIKKIARGMASDKD